MSVAVKWKERFARRVNPSTGTVTISSQEQAEIISDLVGMHNIPIGTKKRLTLDQIKAIVSDYSCVTVEQMESSSRESPIVTARCISMYFARKYTPFGLKFIGKMHSRDHATVLHSIRNVQKWLEIDPVVRGMIADIQNNIEQILKS
jgi:chromosomal replication initiation ATPase DnaA